MPMTYALDQALLGHYLGTPYAAPAPIYLSLHLASPTKVGAHTQEVPSAGTGYARQSLAGKLGTIDGTGQTTNVGTITFPALTADYGGAVTYLATESDVTAGTMGFFDALTEAPLKSVGQAYQFTPAQISIRLD